MIKIYHNPRCSKSRAGLQYLTDNNIDHEVVNYLKDGLSPEKVEELVALTGKPVTDLIRTHEKYYKENLKGNSYSDKEWFKIIAENPSLLHRPIVVKENRAVFAQPPQEIDKL